MHVYCTILNTKKLHLNPFIIAHDLCVLLYAFAKTLTPLVLLMPCRHLDCLRVAVTVI